MPTIIVDGETNASEEVPASQEAVETEAVEAAAEAAVEIAQIEADARVAVEELAQETAIVAIEASQGEREEWQRNLEQQMVSLQTQQAEQSSTLSNLTEMVQALANHPQVEEVVSQEVTPENQEAPEPEQPKRKQKFRLI